MNNKTFVILSLSPWDYEFGSNIRDMALELSKNHQVLFVNIPVKRTELWKSEKPWMSKRKKVVESKSNHFERVNDNLEILTTPVVFEPINRLKPQFIFDILNKRNGKKYANAINKAIKEKEIGDYYLINDNDIYSGLHLPEFLTPKKSIYYLRDNMRAMEYWQTHSHRVEPLLIDTYDVIYTNSTYLCSYASNFNANSEYIGQGCDVEFLIKAPEPLELPSDLAILDGKKVGYIGALNSERLDIDLIEFIAKDNPDFSIVLIGPQDEGFMNSNLHQIENVHFLGSKEFEEIGKYLYNFDACINPQRINDITIGNYPRKIDEYLAVGKPVIASFTETMKPFEEVTYLAKDKKDFSKKMILSIEENTIEKEKQRKELASTHTWKNSMGQMLEHLDSL